MTSTNKSTRVIGDVRLVDVAMEVYSKIEAFLAIQRLYDKKNHEFMKLQNCITEMAKKIL